MLLQRIEDIRYKGEYECENIRAKDIRMKN